MCAYSTCELLCLCAQVCQHICVILYVCGADNTPADQSQDVPEHAFLTTRCHYSLSHNNSRARDAEERKRTRGDTESCEHVCGGVSSLSLNWTHACMVRLFWLFNQAKWVTCRREEKLLVKHCINAHSTYCENIDLMRFRCDIMNILHYWHNYYANSFVG